MDRSFLEEGVGLRGAGGWDGAPTWSQEQATGPLYTLCCFSKCASYNSTHKAAHHTCMCTHIAFMVPGGCGCVCVCVCVCVLGAMLCSQAPTSRALWSSLAQEPRSLWTFSENPPQLHRAPVPKNVPPTWGNSGPVTDQHQGTGASGESSSEGRPDWVPAGLAGMSLWQTPVPLLPLRAPTCIPLKALGQEGKLPADLCLSKSVSQGTRYK